ncbi:MAG: RodZ domain-containing protein [Candidatus Omnitrophota bacterium]
MTIGERLKQARDQKSISLEEAYRQTKIHPNVLQALEEDRAHNFLSAIYIKAFIKTYARYLALDGEQLVREYLGSQKEPPAAPMILPEEIDEKKAKPLTQVDPLVVGRGIAIVIVVLIALILIRFMLMRSVAAPAVTLKTDAPAMRVEIAAPVQKAPAPNKPASAEELLVEIKTKEACWVRVQADDRVVFQMTLEKGRTEKWQAKDKIELRIGKPEALEVRFNGKLIDLAENGVKKGLVITHQSIIGK